MIKNWKSSTQALIFFSKVDNYSGSAAVDVAHEPDLLATFIEIELVDAKHVDPAKHMCRIRSQLSKNCAGIRGYLDRPTVAYHVNCYFRVTPDIGDGGVILYLVDI